MLIELRGTEFNRRTNLSRGLGRFNRGLALIGFRTTGACSTSYSPEPRTEVYRRFHGRGRHLGSGANAAKFTMDVWGKS